MPELTDQEKMERRRQKRQQKILTSAGDRLSRITGTAYPHRSSPTPSPSTSASSLARSETPLQQDAPRQSSRSPSPAIFTRPLTDRTVPSMTTNDDDPSEALGAPAPLDPFSMFNNTSLATGNPPQDLNDLFAAGGGGFPFNPALLASMTGGGPTDASTAPMQQVADPSVKYWNVIHLVSMMLLGIYGVYMEWTTAGMDRLAKLLRPDASEIYTLTHSGAYVPLFWYFATIELCLQSARLFYQQGTMPTNSTLGMIATQLPFPLNTMITVLLRYRLIWSCLVQDCCILVFVVGFAQVLSALLV
ncbi:hypothetical protein BC941DRAFT_442016 [Chlamydoabsidia padenii]|nr:hypothetical protein BC941DRAFT_442016 [Chlamydoabsidia padenii]